MIEARGKPIAFRRRQPKPYEATMDRLRQDLRYALRGLAARPGFTAAALLTLALGIGATTAIFSLLDATLLRPSPYARPDRLMLPAFTIAHAAEPARPDTMRVWSYPKFRTLRAVDRRFSALAGFDVDNMNLTGTGDPERLRVETVSAGYFELLGIRPLLGRTFLPAEDSTPGTHPVVLLGDGLWRRRFGADPSVIATTIRINKVPLTVIGVLPPDFRGLTGTAEAWVPMMMVPALTYAGALEERWSHWFEVVARLKPGVTPAQAVAGMERAGSAIDAAHPSPGESHDRWGATAVSLEAARSDPALGRSLLVLAAAVALVLLIGCANIANLLLARASFRGREVAVRIALGADRRRLVRQFLTESLALALAGGALGIVVAFGATRLISAIRPERLSSWGVAGAQALDLQTASVDGRVLLFALALAILTGMLFGLAPAFAASRPDQTVALKEGSAGATRGAVARLRGRGALVAAEIAMALVLLIGAGLMIQSFARLRAIDPGFRPDHLLTFRIDPTSADYRTATAPVLHARILDRLRALPGVTAASANTCTPLSSACSRSIVMRTDDRTFDPDAWIPIGVHYIQPAYFRTLGIPLLAGRTFDAHARTGGPRVVIINRAAARRLWPGQDPVGHRIKVGIGYFPDDSAAEIIGLVGDVKYAGVDDAARPAVYIPGLQYAPAYAFFLVRTIGDPLALARAASAAVLEVDPDVPISDVRTMEDRAGDVISRTRFAALLFGSFAAVAIALAGIGIYGVMTYSVTQRTREVALRLALGASRGDVLRLVVGQATILALTGIAVGLLAAAALSRLLGGLLFGISPIEPSTFAALAAATAAVALLASIVPALRATRTNPLLALKAE